MAKFDLFADNGDAKEIWGELCRCLKDKNNNDSEDQFTNNETMSPEKKKWISRRLKMDENQNEVENIWRHRGTDSSQINFNNFQLRLEGTRSKSVAETLHFGKNSLQAVDRSTQ